MWHPSVDEALALLGVGARPLWLGMIEVDGETGDDGTGTVRREVRLGLDVTDVPAEELAGPLTGGEWASLRAWAHCLPAGEVRASLSAAALVQWLDSVRFCGRCAGVNEVIEGGWEVVCQCCGRHDHPRQDPAVIMSVLDWDDRLLLAHNRAWEEGRVSLLAGFMEAGESPWRTVVREVAEEVGLRVGEVDYLTAQPWPFPRSLMLAHRCRLVEGEEPVPRPDGVEITSARFYSREELARVVERGEIVLPGPSAIATVIIEDWYGAPLPRPQSV